MCKMNSESVSLLHCGEIRTNSSTIRLYIDVVNYSHNYGNAFISRPTADSDTPVVSSGVGNI